MQARLLRCQLDAVSVESLHEFLSTKDGSAASVSMHKRVRACMRACVGGCVCVCVGCACARAGVGVCVCVCVCVWLSVCLRLRLREPALVRAAGRRRRPSPTRTTSSSQSSPRAARSLMNACRTSVLAVFRFFLLVVMVQGLCCRSLKTREPFKLAACMLRVLNAESGMLG